MSCHRSNVKNINDLPLVFRKKEFIPFSFKTSKPLEVKDLFSFRGNLFQPQLLIFNKIRKRFLQGKTGLLLVLPTGFGKTPFSLYIISKVLSRNGKVLVLVPRTLIKRQWEESIEKFVPDLKNNIEISCFASYKKLPPNRYSYEIIILDEVHTYCDLTFTNLLYQYSPEILIGLTATPKLQFQEYEYFFNDTIDHHIDKSFKVYPITLNFEPLERYIRRYGKQTIDYTYMLSSLMIEERFVRISNIIEEFYNLFKRRTLVLSKRIKTVDEIINNLSIEADYIYGNKLTYSNTTPIVVGTYDKMGLGINDNTFSMLIILDNIKDVRQAEGRIRQDNFIIVDIADLHSIFTNHWNVRKKWYENRGGKIINL